VAGIAASDQLQLLQQVHGRRGRQEAAQDSSLKRSKTCYKTCYPSTSATRRTTSWEVDIAQSKYSGQLKKSMM
jgi:hypothetical protein